MDNSAGKSGLLIEKAGHLYLGEVVDPNLSGAESEPLFYPLKNLTTHAFCVGMTGSGKTGLGISVLEELALSGVPALIIDPKGDLGDLCLTFPNLSAEEFLPWVDTTGAARKGETPEKIAEETANEWEKGLSGWGIGAERIAALKDKVDIAIYTPASKTGISISILTSFSAPSKEFMRDSGAMRDRVLTTTSSLLGLIGIEADPIKSREHILISTLFDRSWQESIDLNLGNLIGQIQNPPFDKIGVLDLESFFPEKERLALSIRLNNLLASPGFHAWMEGEPLDIDRLLYSENGKPQLAVLSIAHLSDPERMFFVTLLLNELVSWMRRQTGTSDLRALLYMDEIAGFFPPSRIPPSKPPMLTLLKQARAFGLGVVLATQNPVDLDYKGLANCGTWFIGKLQTERDKARVLEGLNTTSSDTMDSSTMDRMVAALSKRHFILRSVNLPKPLLFQTRWTMSYLKGPLSGKEINRLMAGRIKKGNSFAMNRSINAQKSHHNLDKPIVPSGVQELFVPPGSHISLPNFKPKILGVGKLHFIEAKSKIDLWQEVAIAAPLSNNGLDVLWGQGEDVTTVVSAFEKGTPEKGTYSDLPAGLMQSKNYNLFGRSLSDHLYQTKTIDLFEAKDAKIISNPGESESDFRSRVSDMMQEQLENNIKTINDRYSNKVRVVEDKIRRLLAKAETQKSQVFRSKLDTFISIGQSLLKAFFGRKVSAGSITEAGTSIRKASKIGKEENDVAQVTDSLIALRQQRDHILMERENEIAEARNAVTPMSLPLEKLTVRPRKNDVEVELVALLWCP